MVVLTLLVLAIVAASTIYMVYISYILLGWNYAAISVFFLAIHCTVFDFVVWGYSWYSEMTQNNGEYVDIDPNENNINPLFIASWLKFCVFVHLKMLYIYIIINN
jgi:hypothetical protein